MTPDTHYSLHVLPLFCNNISVAIKFMGGALGHAYLYHIYTPTIIIYAPTSHNNIKGVVGQWRRVHTQGRITRGHVRMRRKLRVCCIPSGSLEFEDSVSEASRPWASLSYVLRNPEEPTSLIFSFKFTLILQEQLLVRIDIARESRGDQLLTEDTVRWVLFSS